MASPGPVARIALFGCPNSGKTSVFNLLTGRFQRIANYPGVTVSLSSGQLRLPNGRNAEVLDLPGCYGLSGATEEQALPRDLLYGKLAGEAVPDLIVCVLDACQLKQQLPLAIDLHRLGLPLVIALNQADMAGRLGISIDIDRLAELLQAPCVWSVATRRSGVRKLTEVIAASLPGPERIAARPERQPLKADEVLAEVLRSPGRDDTFGARLDGLLLHPLLGPPLLLATLFVVFQSVFTWSAVPSEWIAGLLEALSQWLAATLPSGWPTDLLVAGVLPGLGVVLEFLPPILLLSFFLLLLEGSGYISRMAFLCDALLARAGLGGHSVFPLLSGFACAIPAIMSARSIPDGRSRLAVVLALPLIPCSARLPVYTLVTAAVIPPGELAGFDLRGLVLMSFYVFGVLISLAVAAVISYQLGGNPAVPMELPAWRWPNPRNLILGLWLRAKHFLKRAGTLILAVVVLLWLFSEIPVTDAEGVRGSLIGVLGGWLHPLFAPLGFSWEMTVALLPGLLAREVAVAALATIYAIEGGSGAGLAQTLSQAWPLATGLAFATWYVFAPQCVATWGTIRAETGSWRPVVATVALFFLLAWIAAFIVQQLF